MKKSNRRIQNSDMYRAILTLKTEEECKAFFTDLCSITELMAMEQRSLAVPDATQRICQVLRELCGEPQ